MAGMQVVVVGSSLAGKTCLVQRFHTGKFVTNRPKTPVDTVFCNMVLEPDQRATSFIVRDVTGCERFRIATNPAFRDVEVALLVYDITDEKSFIEATTVWYQRLLTDCPRARLMLVGTKADKALQRAVPVSLARSYADDHNLIYFETSAATGYNVTRVFEAIGHILRRAGHHFELSDRTSRARLRPVPVEVEKPFLCAVCCTIL